ncbi:hypothetical protein ACI48D_19355 [Massilia sp. LXY-6]|uniref:hypothetical protein n=1 Tax=Massilia sp. LXY-6 TaxID=3379823 RepID=UPI003EDE804C
MLTEPHAGPAGRSILFSGPMVRALLAGTKTQTRRAQHRAPGSARKRFGQPGDRLWVRETFFAFGRWETRFNAGKGREERYFVDMTRESGLAWRYEADEGAGADPHARREAGAAPAWHKRPALFMPRAASRIVLEIVGVRVERLQEISPGDALAEGIVPGTLDDPVQAYRGVWERINGDGSWEANPLVWVVEFRQVH